VTIRRILQSICNLGPTLCLVLISFVPMPVPAVVALLVLALGFHGCYDAGIGANHYDLSTKYAGVLVSINNTSGSVPGILGAWLTGWMLAQTGNNWASVFMLAAAIAVAGLISFLILVRGKPVDFDSRGVGCCNGNGNYVSTSAPAKGGPRVPSSDAKPE